MFSLPPAAHIHLIAICGTAMGSLAGMLRERGYRVTGSDTHVYPPMSTFLAEQGIEVQAGFDPARLDPAPDLVVVGNAVSRGNPEVEAMLDRQLPYASLPEVLRDLFLRGKRPVVVTGTHGKTTTTAMVAHLLTEGGLDPSFLVAGLPRNFPRSFALGNGEFFAVEGDEYDSAFFAKWAKFFYYLPEVLIVNNIEFDHADIYENLAAIEKAFRQVINLVPGRGVVLAGSADPVLARLLPLAPAPVQTFGLEAGAHWLATELRGGPEGQEFTLRRQGEDLGRFFLPLTGEYNVRNALAALAVGLRAGAPVEGLRGALRTFSGVRRRQERLGAVGGITLIDDFAHHPTAVGQTLQGLRQAYPEAGLWAVFEPASASNARAVFEAQYLQAFAPADQVVIGKVPRPDRARGGEPFSGERLVAGLRAQGKGAWHLPEVDAILAHLEAQVRPGDVVVFMSNGGFGGVQGRFLAALKGRYGTA
ncbi:MAG: UDP-N-acetylmuramate:L-alanyl-gamma-D-glutamyl-meso-diaminopimelate ligase [Candidatus Latescibacteria bacterium]|nr:UDP-N-acetylmuramate:L-alanyl-gamma-D-glutamyl-meso-diaminopimelate ligase [Candidatus Latescibacterota bacterium]